MVSSALKSWRGKRRDDIDQLLSTHRVITGGRRGRQWETEHMNFALITRLAAEFQGYCRDLHTEAVDHIVTMASIPNPNLNLIFRSAYIDRRMLKVGNPSWANLCKDFNMFGMDLKSAMESQFGQARFGTWRLALDDLVDARNAIAHSNDEEIKKCRAKHPHGLSVRSARGWRAKLNSFTAGLDIVVGKHLKGLTGLGPW